MLALKPWNRPLAEVLAFKESIPAEQRIELDTLYPTLLALQEHADVAVQALYGLYVPPHQGTMLDVANLGAGSNFNISSRGTSKSSATCVLTASHRAMTFAKRKGVELAATGFRGGQLIFNDLKRLAEGGWIDQEEGLRFLSASAKNPDIVHRGQNSWEVDLRSFSNLRTFPTTNPDMIRGIRGNDLYCDEANFMEEELIEKVAIPFLNVVGDFKHGGAFAKKNSVFFCSTIDYDWRPFQKRLVAARDSIKRDVLAREAQEAGQTALYDELVKEGLYDTTYVCFDYTDTIIRKHGVTRDGHRYTIKKYPNKHMQLQKFPEGIPFTERDARGFLRKQSGPIEGWTTYPLDKKKVEEGIRTGATDEASWLSEQRNVTDTSDGGVYSNPLINRATNEGVRYVLPFKECGDGWRKKYRETLTDFAPTVQWTCKDPCVLGVDFASVNDFSAFVVIRLGPMAEGTFNPLTGEGNTPWSNVVWCEQHRGTSHKDVMLKIHELAKRYNLVYFYDENEEDMWKVCRAIGLDLRGGGFGVRDELLLSDKSADDLAADEFRIYDPRDKDERIQAVHMQPKSKPMLDGITADDRFNSNMVEYTIGQMENELLYLPKWIPESERQDQPQLQPGFTAAKALAAQLRKLRQKPTKAARTFYMEGNVNLVENKKDMWASFIYAAKQMRAHLIRVKMINEAPPPMGGVVTRVNSAVRGIAGRSPGARS